MKILNSYFRSIPSLDGARVELASVLVEDATGDYAVYVAVVPEALGVGPRSRHIACDWIAAHGAKQSFIDAAYYFKGLESDKYRR